MQSFGELGRRAILLGLHSFTQNGQRLPRADQVSPMSLQDWFENVFVIEAAVLLIRQDLARAKATTEQDSDGDDKNPGSATTEFWGPRDEALTILKESRDYGRMRFGVDSDYDVTPATVDERHASSHEDDSQERVRARGSDWKFESTQVALRGIHR